MDVMIDSDECTYIFSPTLLQISPEVSRKLSFVCGSNSASIFNIFIFNDFYRILKEELLNA